MSGVRLVVSVARRCRRASLSVLGSGGGAYATKQAGSLSVTLSLTSFLAVYFFGKAKRGCGKGRARSKEGELSLNGTRRAPLGVRTRACFHGHGARPLKEGEGLIDKRPAFLHCLAAAATL